jgi:quinol-cytochrome oxidoreductase complex cytochrome b subunit
MVTALLKHLFPRRVLETNLRITYTFGLGGLALTTLLLLFGSGLLLLFYYAPSPERAHGSIQFIEIDVWGGSYLRSLHRLASHALLLLVALHALRVILTGAFKRERRLNWIVGCLLLFLAVFTAYTGYLLPADQLAYWATQTGMELLRALPAGDMFRSLLVPDTVGGPLSLLRFYALHVVVLPGAMFGLSMLHFFIIRRQRGLLPYGTESAYVSSTPRLFRLVTFGFALGTAVLLLAAVSIPAPLDMPADPAHAPNPAKSAWFLLWIQELVSYSTSAIYVALLLVATFVALPWLPVPTLERAAWFPREHRLVSIFVLAACGFVLALTVVGLFMRGPDWRFVSPF